MYWPLRTCPFVMLVVFTSLGGSEGIEDRFTDPGTPFMLSDLSIGCCADSEGDDTDDVEQQPLEVAVPAMLDREFVLDVGVWCADLDSGSCVAGTQQEAFAVLAAGCVVSCTGVIVLVDAICGNWKPSNLLKSVDPWFAV